MTGITLDDANAVIDGAFANAREKALKPMVAVVVDAGGYLIALQRQDGSAALRSQLAAGKASGAVLLGYSSRQIEALAAERPAFVAALGPVTPHGLVPAAGGIIIVDEQGTPIGAVGVTGDTPDNDEACALAGIKAAGLIAKA